MKKIVWSSNAPWAGTGYGMQTALFAPRIRDLGYDVAISAFWGLQGSQMEWDGMQVYPTDHTHFGKAMLPYYVGHHAGNDCDPRDVLVITLQDVWALTSQKLAPLRMASWCPVDHAPLPPRILEFFQVTGSTPIAMSRFGETMLRDAGLDPLYVPHAVDTNILAPDPVVRAVAREQLGIDDDAFVIGMVANNKGCNPPRKAFPQVFQAFAGFRKKHPNAILYLHTDVFGVDQGINLVALAEINGIPVEAMKTTNQLLMHLGMPQEAMAGVYNAMDVLASPSYGEGFGVPIIEAQACGVPVIVTDWTAMPELCGAGWKVIGDPFYDPPHGAFYMCPSVMEILAAFEAAHEARHDQELRARAREFALGYDADRVMAEHWVPVLEALDRPREVPPLRAASNGGGNRAQRRAALKHSKVTAA